MQSISSSPSHIVHVPAFAVQSPIAGSAGLSISPKRGSSPQSLSSSSSSPLQQTTASFTSSSSPQAQAHPVSNAAAFLSPEQLRTGLELQDLLVQHQLMQQQLEMQSRMIEKLTLSIANASNTSASSSPGPSGEVSYGGETNEMKKLTVESTSSTGSHTTEPVTALTAEAQYLQQQQQHQQQQHLQYQLWQQQQQQMYLIQQQQQQQQQQQYLPVLRQQSAESSGNTGYQNVGVFKSNEQYEQFLIAQQMWMYQQQQQQQQQQGQEYYQYQRMETVLAAEKAVRQNLLLQKSLLAQKNMLLQQQQHKQRTSTSSRGGVLKAGFAGDSRFSGKKNSHYNNYSTLNSSLSSSSSLLTSRNGNAREGRPINPSKVVAKLQTPLSSPLGSRSSSNASTTTTSRSHQQQHHHQLLSSQSQSQAEQSYETESGITMKQNDQENGVHTITINTSPSPPQQVIENIEGNIDEGNTYIGTVPVHDENNESTIPPPATQLPLQVSSLSRSSSPISYLEEDQIHRSSRTISPIAPDSLQDADDITASVIFPLQPQSLPSSSSSDNIYSHELMARPPSRMGTSLQNQNLHVESPRRLSSIPSASKPLLSPSDTSKSPPRPATATTFSLPRRQESKTTRFDDDSQQQQRQQKVESKQQVISTRKQTGMFNISKSRIGTNGVPVNEQRRSGSRSSGAITSSSISRSSSNSRVNSASSIRIMSPRSAQSNRQAHNQQQHHHLHHLHHHQQLQSDNPNYYENEHAVSASVFEDAAGSALGSIVYEQKDPSSSTSSTFSPSGGATLLHESSIEGVPDWEVSRGLGRKREIEDRFGKGRAGTFSFESKRAMAVPMSDLTSPYMLTPWQLTQYKGPSSGIQQGSKGGSRSRPTSSSRADLQKQPVIVKTVSHKGPTGKRMTSHSSTAAINVVTQSQSPREGVSKASPSLRQKPSPSSSVIPEFIESNSPTRQNPLNNSSITSSSLSPFVNTQSPSQAQERDRFFMEAVAGAASAAVRAALLYRSSQGGENEIISETEIAQATAAAAAAAAAATMSTMMSSKKSANTNSPLVSSS
jgi:hypothetical protein